MASQGDYLRKVQPGEKLAHIPRDAYNAFVDAANLAKRTGDVGAGSGASWTRDTSIVTIRNTTGADVPRFGVLELGDPIILAENNEIEWANRVNFEGIIPTGLDVDICILLEPLRDGAIGRAAVAGVMPMLLDLNDADDEGCIPVVGEVGWMETIGSGGLARVLWVEDNPDEEGLYNAYVLLADGASGTVHARVTSASTTAGNYPAVVEAWNGSEWTTGDVIWLKPPNGETLVSTRRYLAKPTGKTISDVALYANQETEGYQDAYVDVVTNICAITTEITVDLASDDDVTGILGVANGGTGLDGSGASNGQLLIGNSGGFTLSTLTPAGQISITNSAGSITINTTGFTGTVP